MNPPPKAGDLFLRKKWVRKVFYPQRTRPGIYHTCLSLITYILDILFLRFSSWAFCTALLAIQINLAVKFVTALSQIQYQDVWLIFQLIFLYLVTQLIQYHLYHYSTILKNRPNLYICIKNYVCFSQNAESHLYPEWDASHFGYRN